MGKVDRASSIKKSRIRTSYVDRMRQISKTTAVSPVNKVNPVANNTAYSSSNHLFSSDEFYDQMSHLGDKYVEFYELERQIQENIKKTIENPGKVLKNMKEFLSLYNKIMKVLEKIDEDFGTDYSLKLMVVISKFKTELNLIGINTDDYMNLKMNTRMFLERVSRTSNALMFVFHPTEGILMRVSNIIKNVKEPKENKNISYNDYYDKEFDHKGLIMDEKS